MKNFKKFLLLKESKILDYSNYLKIGDRVRVYFYNNVDWNNKKRKWITRSTDENGNLLSVIGTIITLDREIDLITVQTEDTGNWNFFLGDLHNNLRIVKLNK